MCTADRTPRVERFIINFNFEYCNNKNVLDRRKKETLGPTKFVRNGISDGCVIRLASMKEKHIPTATRVEERPDGSIDVWFDRIFLEHYGKGEYMTFWPVQTERPGTRMNK
jgi:hypothetical protein